MATAKGRETRARIIDSGLELFLAKGSTSVSLREIAGAAGVSPMAIYRHFDDKAALQLALLENAFGLFEEYLKKASRRGTPLTRLRSLAASFFDFAMEREPHFRWLFLSDSRPADSSSRKRVIELSRPTFSILREAVDLCQEDGHFKKRDPHELTVDMLAFCIGWASLIISRNFDYESSRAKVEARRGFDRYLEQLTENR